MKALLILPMLLATAICGLAQVPDGKGKERQAATPAQPKDEAAIAECKSTAEKFVQLLDKKQFKQASRMSYIGERASLENDKTEKYPMVTEYKLNRRALDKKQYGKMLSREFVKVEEVTKGALPLPDGKYYRVFYKTPYEKKSDDWLVVTICASEPQAQTVVDF